MRVFNAYNTRLVALMSFVGALLYYQYSGPLLNTETVVQVNEDGKLVNISLSPEELASYLGLQQLQPKKNQNNEIKAESKSLESPPSLSPLPSPPKPPSPPDPPIKLPKINWELKSSISKSNPDYLPVLKPSNGSFLDTLDISGRNKKVGHVDSMYYTLVFLHIEGHVSKKS